jgi:lipopolysaccharide/colanic/teichoic acid biosynthesis glycosyltransferase
MRVYPIIKRLLDAVVAAGLLLLLAPLMGGIAGWIRCASGAPVLFRQTRIGQGGRSFTLLKFRTLWPGAADPAQPLAHVTPEGRLLRRWALDELPQLWNVLRGAMSLVGPRPTLPEQVARYGPVEHRRHAVRPGLTGWAQLHGRNSLDWSARIRYDLWYVDHLSFRLDLYILWRTPALLWSGEGLYGADGQNPDFPSEPSPAA